MPWPRAHPEAAPSTARRGGRDAGRGLGGSGGSTGGGGRRPRARLPFPIWPLVGEILERHWKRSGRVCGRLPVSDSSLYKALHRPCDCAGVPRGWSHALRHTAATRLTAAGTVVATIGRILGHRPGSVGTLRYLHSDDDRLRRATETVAHVIQGA